MRKALSIACATLALAACGGGGGGGRDHPTQVVGSQPVAPFGVRADQSFAVLGWTAPPATSDWSAIAPDTVTFSWSATRGTYLLDLKDVGSGGLVYTFPGNNPLEFTLMHDDGSAAPLAIIVFPQSKATGRLWWLPLNGATSSMGIAAFGIATSVSDIPAIGTRQFVGNEGPDYAPAFAFDFVSGTLTGQVRIAWEDAWGPYPANTYDLSPASFDRSANTFSATFSVPGAPTQGSIHGMFMGPGAREVAVAWQGPIVDPYSGQWMTVRGVWLANCTNCGN